MTAIRVLGIHTCRTNRIPLWQDIAMTLMTLTRNKQGGQDTSCKWESNATKLHTFMCIQVPPARYCSIICDMLKISCLSLCKGHIFCSGKKNNEHFYWMRDLSENITDSKLFYFIRRPPPLLPVESEWPSQMAKSRYPYIINHNFSKTHQYVFYDLI